MKIILPPGETLIIELQDSEGQFQISYGEFVNQHLTIHTDFPDSLGREGLIYDEDFSISPDGTASGQGWEIFPSKSAADATLLKLTNPVVRDSTGADDPAIVGDYDSPHHRLHSLAMQTDRMGLKNAMDQVYGIDHTWFVRDLLKAVSRG